MWASAQNSQRYSYHLRHRRKRVANSFSFVFFFFFFPEWKVRKLKRRVQQGGGFSMLPIKDVFCNFINLVRVHEILVLLTNTN